MTSLQKLKEFGEGMGLKGEVLCTFIKEQQAEERAARASEREQIERDKARDLEKMKIELEQRKIEQEAREKQMEMELRKMRMDKASEGSTEDYLGHSLVQHVPSKMPKMPCFDENTDCMDAYLNRFEKVADAQGWKKENLAIVCQHY